jgi:hypothetical protein
VLNNFFVSLCASSWGQTQLQIPSLRQALDVSGNFMCDVCFNNEIESFSTVEDFRKFDLSLTNKLADGKSMRMGQYVNTGWKDIGYQVYECLNCGQVWKLSNSENSEGRQFLKTTLKNIKRDTTPFYSQSKFLISLLFVIAIVVLLLVVLI